MSLKLEISGFIETKVHQANQRGFYRQPLTGFSSASDPLYAAIKEIVGPHHLRPEDVLPEVKTVVSFFLPFSKEVVEANRKEATDPAREWVDAYVHANDLIEEINLELVELLKSKGLGAGMVRTADNYDGINLRAPWSHRSAAFIAGLGRFGLNRMLITPVGAAGRFGTMFISEEIQPSTRPANELCLFFKNGGCGFCLKHCPPKALGGGPDEFDRQACNRKLLQVTPYTSSLGMDLDVCGKCDVGPCAIF